MLPPCFPFFPALGKQHLVIGASLGPDSSLIMPLKCLLSVVSLILPTTCKDAPPFSRALIREDREIGERVVALLYQHCRRCSGLFSGGFVAVEALGLSTR